MRFDTATLFLALSVACASAPPAPPTPIPTPTVLPTVSATKDASTQRPPWAFEYPATRSVPLVEQRFGLSFSDPYRWLEDGQSPEVQEWMTAQGALARKHLEGLPMRAAIASRMHELMYTDSRGVPKVRGQRLFFSSRSAKQEKSVLYRRDADGKDRVVLDPNTWPTTDNPSLKDWFPSWDGSKVAYTVSLHNGDESTLRVLDVATGHDTAADVIPYLNFPDVSWTPDGRGFYYRYLPPRAPGDKESDRFALTEIRFHALGAPIAKDKLLREKTGDPTLWLDCGLSRDGRWLISNVSRGDVWSAVSFLDLRAKNPTWTTLTERGRASSYVQVYRDRFYLVTNDGAPSWRIFAVDPAHPDRASWKEIVPERKDARLEYADIVGGHLVLKYFKDVITKLEVRKLDGTFVREMTLPDLGTASFPFGEEDRDDAYFSFSSFTRSPEIERVSIARGTSEVWYRENVPADLSPFVTEQVFYPSKDGTRVPMFIVRAKNAKKDGSSPLLLKAYGGFDITYGSEFSRTIVPWLEHGGTYAWASLRGGGEYGESWHRAGMLHAKQNVFDDFIAAAEYLVREGYTRTDRLAAMGRSNGGLLMGAMATQRPDLFRVILCGAPLEDLIRYPLVGAGEHWVAEYGDPNVEADFKALLAYSPLHHVEDGVRYPSFLLLSPANDDRVDPMHARKFVAELQAASTGGPVLLRVEKNAGHSGTDTRASDTDNWTDQLAFALSEIGGVGDSMK